MVFTSYAYLLFLTAALPLHWLLPRSFRKAFLVLCSYVFYCSWRWEYGFLLLGVSLFNWAYGRWVLARADSGGRLSIGILMNLAPLLYFKYTGFALTNAVWIANFLGAEWHPALPDILLPLGISFFTFQGIAYLIDVASGEEPFRRLLDFLLYKGFWPQLIAGPIIRPREIRGQIQGERTLDSARFVAGCERILFGFAKKKILADTLAPIVERVFEGGAAANATDAAAGVLGFGLQVYFDFGAYCDIAIGTAMLFGFTFPENFDWPYLSRSPQEFWSRWHMTLSRWIRDYVFTPMAFAARRRPGLAPLWLVAAMAICGLWHGAQWTFVLWGVWHGLLLALNQTWLRRFFAAAAPSSSEPIPRALLRIAVTFMLVSLGWALFRARSMEGAWAVWSAILFVKGGLHPGVLPVRSIGVVAVVFLLLLSAQAFRYVRERRSEAFENVESAIRALKPFLYVILYFAVVFFSALGTTPFMYFQF